MNYSGFSDLFLETKDWNKCYCLINLFGALRAFAFVTCQLIAETGGHGSHIAHCLSTRYHQPWAQSLLKSDASF